MKTSIDHDYQAEDEVGVSIHLNEKDIDNGVDIDKLVALIKVGNGIKKVFHASGDDEYADVILTLESGYTHIQIRAAIRVAFKAAK